MGHYRGFSERTLATMCRRRESDTPDRMIRTPRRVVRRILNEDWRHRGSIASQRLPTEGEGGRIWGRLYVHQVLTTFFHRRPMTIRM